MAKSKMTRIEKRKKFEALFDRGGYVRFNRDEKGHPVVDPEVESESDMKVWIGPPSPLQREMAVREAQAARARTMLNARTKEDSQDWLTIRGYVTGLSAAALIDYVLDLDEGEHISGARRDVLTQKEWDDFDTLRDAMRQYEEAGSPVGDPEWDSLLERDRAFGDQVSDRTEEIRSDARAGYELMPRAVLEEKAMERRVEQAGSASFLSSYEELMLFYACRDDDDHADLYFETVDEIKGLPVEVQTALANKLAGFINEAAEAKN